MTSPSKTNQPRPHAHDAASNLNGNAASKPVQRGLLIPLAVVLLLLVGGFATALLDMQQKNLARSSQKQLRAVSSGLEKRLEDQAQMLSALVSGLLADKDLIGAIKAQDRDRLLAFGSPLRRRLQAEHGITCFFVHSPDRVNLLRVCKPEKNGDIIDSFTAREAERTGKKSSGIEVGPLGTFTLRVVQPVFDDETLIGYLELGKGIEDILALICNRRGIELAVLLHKDALNRERWESGMRMLGRENDWERFPHAVLTYVSLPNFPAEAEPFVNDSGRTRRNQNAEIAFGDKPWWVLFSPLKDASGTEVGDLIVFQDTSEARAQFNRFLAVSAVPALVLLAALMGILFIALRQIDRGILAREADLAKSEKFQRTLIETSPDFIAILDQDMTFRVVNRLVHGVREEDFIGRSALSFVAPEYVDDLRKAFAQAIETQELQSVETRVRMPDGDHFYLSRLNPLPEANEDRAVVLIASEITERKRAEQARELLLERQTKLNKLQRDLLGSETLEEKLRMITDGVVAIFGADFCRIWITQPGDLCESGCIHAEVTEGQHICQDRDRCLKLMASSGRYTHIDGKVHRRVPSGCYKIGVIASGEESKFLTNEATTNPHVHNTDWAKELGLISFAGYQLRPPGGETIGVLALFAKHVIAAEEDALLASLGSWVAQVIQKAKSDEALDAAKQKAEAANRSKSEFLANMSHEIRTPMTAILGFTENMLNPNLSNSDRLDAVDTVHRNGKHLLQIINNILDISKIEAGKLQIERIRCSPIQLVADVQSLMQVRADAKHISLISEYIGAVPETIETDPTGLKQILMNIIGNAIKFTETGGVRLETRFLNPDPVPGTGPTDPMIQFDIIDSGIGMTQEQSSKLFQAFVQADASTTRKFGGTGLGLNISKRLTEMLDGDLTVESKPGEGSTFRLAIKTGPLDGVKMLEGPAAVEFKKPTQTNAVTGDTTVLAGCRILLAEDGPDNQRLISHILKRAGAEIAAAENGQRAVAAALEARENDALFHVILMDMQMPVMDGYDATALLRQQGYTHPIIALTANAMASDRNKCIDIGCDDYLKKPIDRHLLIQRVVQWARIGKADRSHTNEEKRPLVQV